MGSQVVILCKNRCYLCSCSSSVQPADTPSLLFFSSRRHKKYPLHLTFFSLRTKIRIHDSPFTALQFDSLSVCGALNKFTISSRVNACHILSQWCQCAEFFKHCRSVSHLKLKHNMEIICPRHDLSQFFAGFLFEAEHWDTFCLFWFVVSNQTLFSSVSWLMSLSNINVWS